MLTVLGFTALHQLLISDIWFSLAPMLVAGAACGLCLAWSYGTTRGGRSAWRWYAYDASYVLALLAMGAASLAILEPRLTMAELMVAADPLGDLLPPALPLLVAGPLVGTLVTWWLFGRGRASFVPILVTQCVVGLLLGHNLAALGAVRWEAAMGPLLAEFVGLTAGLALAYSVAAHLGSRLLHRPAGSGAPPGIRRPARRRDARRSG